MARPQLQVLRQSAERLERPEQLRRRAAHRAFDADRALEQIGPAHVADEQEVAAHDADGELARRFVGDDEHEVLGSVSGRVSDIQAHAAERQRVAVPEAARARPAQACRRPLIASLGGQEQLGTGLAGERLGAGEEVGVHVRLRDELDAHVVERGGLHVSRGVAERIDHDRPARRLAGDQVARLRESVVVEAPEDHRGWQEAPLLVTATAQR